MVAYAIKTDPVIFSKDLKRNDKLTEFGKKTLNQQYLLPNEDFQDLFVRVATTYADDDEHAKRLYDYMSNLWFMPATPVLSNGGAKRGLPISCFLNETKDSLDGILKLWDENVWLASKGGGIGSYWGNLRSIGEKVGLNGQTSGVVPFMKVMDSMTLAISQGSLRRGASAIYLPIWHPEIEEFIEIRRPTGGDYNRKTLNLHHGVVICDDFMQAVIEDKPWGLKSPKDGVVLRYISARNLWIRLLATRVETGEPYILYIDHVNRAIPAHHRKQGLFVKTSNLCTEITLATGTDHLGQDRTAVCCLSSLNLETYLQWQGNEQFIEDILRFLDNVLQDFINNAPDSMERAKYSAMRERSVGLGVMGFHSFLQSKRVPFESVTAMAWNNKIFKFIKETSDKVSIKLANERGSCPDAADEGVKERFSNKIAIAPTATISIICGGTSPGIEPYPSNGYTHKTLSGSSTVKNKHLENLLKEKNHNNDETWSSIFAHGGSVQHLPYLTQEEKDIFKTAFEIDQRWLIDLAAARQPYICQGQSLNLFFLANTSKKDLHHVHMRAWQKGIKSLYYVRSKSIQRAESRFTNGHTMETMMPTAATLVNDECLSCQ